MVVIKLIVINYYRKTIINRFSLLQLINYILHINFLFVDPLFVINFLYQ